MRLSKWNNTFVDVTRVTLETLEGMRYFSYLRKKQPRSNRFRKKKPEIQTTKLTQSQNKLLQALLCRLPFTKPAHNLFLWLLIWFKLEYNSTSQLLNFHKLNIYLFQYRRLESEPFKVRVLWPIKANRLWPGIPHLSRKFHFRKSLEIFNVCFGEMKQNFNNRLAKGQSKLVLGSETWSK